MNEGLLVALGSVITAVIGALGLFLNSYFQRKQERHKSTIEEYQVIVERQSQQLSRQQNQIDAQQKVINRLYTINAESQVHISDTYGWLLRTHEIAARYADMLKREGEDPGVVPPLPSRPPVKLGEDAEFLARTTEGNTRLLQAIDDKLDKQSSTVAGGGK